MTAPEIIVLRRPRRPHPPVVAPSRKQTRERKPRWADRGEILGLFSEARRR